MKNFVDQFFDKLVELNFGLAIICVTIIFIVLGHQGCVNNQLENKNKALYMNNCVNKGVAPTDCAIGWRTSRNP